MAESKEIKDRLYELRTFSDISTAEMAEKLGVTENEYIAFENGEDEAPIWLVYKFASIVDIEENNPRKSTPRQFTKIRANASKGTPGILSRRLPPIFRTSR